MKTNVSSPTKEFKLADRLISICRSFFSFAKKTSQKRLAELILRARQHPPTHIIQLLPRFFCFRYRKKSDASQSKLSFKCMKAGIISPLIILTLMKSNILTKSAYFGILLGLLSISSFTSCSDDSDSSQCNQSIKISASGYDNGPDDHVQITNAEIMDNCLKITFGASGCSGDNWIVELYDASVVLESFPVQRNIRLSLDNKEDCLAFFTREISFDLTPIEIEEYETIILNLKDFDRSIRYEY